MEILAPPLQKALVKFNLESIAVKLGQDEMTTVEDVLDLTATELRDEYGIKFAAAKKLLRQLREGSVAEFTAGARAATPVEAEMNQEGGGEEGESFS